MSKKKRAKVQARHPRTDERLVIRVHLPGSDPEIRRRISLDPELTLYQVHGVPQVIFEWKNDHLHDFTQRREGKPDATYAPPWHVLKVSPYPSGDVDEVTVKLGSLFRRLGSTLHYTYDPMTDWTHLLTVEERRPATADEPRAQLLDGEMAAPEESIGGIARHPELLNVWRNPRHPDREAWLDAIDDIYGDEFDPETFDLEALRAKLATSLANDLASWDPTVESVFDVE